MLSAIPEQRRGFFLVRGYMGLQDEEAARSLVEDYRAGDSPDEDELLGSGPLVRSCTMARAARRYGLVTSVAPAPRK
jgi:hypothetical protein